jgi:hypothetical protein
MQQSITWLATLAFMPIAASAAADHGSHGEELGAVQVHASCKAAAMPHLKEGLALLHHMTYERADQAFEKAANADPACALAFWGRAMTYIHPLWTDPPTAETFGRGQQFVERAKSLQPSTPEERAYIAAVEVYYREGRSATETANLAAFADGWEQTHKQHPDDLEAASFHALGLLATADPQDKTFARQARAAEIAASIRARVPRHPGAHHYIIHAFDYPPLADQALEVARHYGDIAPDSSGNSGRARPRSSPAFPQATRGIASRRSKRSRGLRAPSVRRGRAISPRRRRHSASSRRCARRPRKLRTTGRRRSTSSGQPLLPGWLTRRATKRRRSNRCERRRSSKLRPRNIP